jgi:hypothetical protein
MKPRLLDRASVTMAVILLAMVIIEYLIVPHPYPYFPWHYLPGYAAIIGLGGCLIVVQLSKALGKALLQRPENNVE